MNRTLLLALAFAAVSVPAAQPLLAAPRAAFTASPSSQTDTRKKIQMTLSNDTPTAMEFKVGDDVLTLDAGKAIALKVPVGTRIVTNKTYANHQAGELIAEITPDLNHAILHVK